MQNKLLADQSNGTYEVPVKKLLQILGELRDVHDDITVKQLQCLLLVAAHEGITQRELYLRMGSNDSTSSRIVAMLSDVGNKTIPDGLGYISYSENPLDRREHPLVLTPKGRRLMARINSVLN